MDQAQARHARDMARKIHEHIAPMIRMMQSIIDTSDKDYEHIPVSMIEQSFTRQIDGICDEIKSVVVDMLPRLK